jgi:uncharacterized protein
VDGRHRPPAVSPFPLQTPDPGAVMRFYGRSLRWLLPVILILSNAAPMSAQYASAANLIEQAINGDAMAQFSLGSAYTTGNGVPKNDAFALVWWRKAAEQGLAGAQFNLGLAYSNGNGVAKDDATAAQWWQKSAEQGLADAQYNLGNAYATGSGVPKDGASAVVWWRKAAEQGLARAQFNLGLAYSNGHGVAKEDAAAAQWWQKAAEQGHADAQYNLAVAYEKGEGVSQDKAQVVQWLSKAAEQGLARAQFNLGLSYSNGNGVAKDDAAAAQWWQKAAEQGDADAQARIAAMSEVAQSARPSTMKNVLAEAPSAVPVTPARPAVEKNANPSHPLPQNTAAVAQNTWKQSAAPVNTSAPAKKQIALTPTVIRNVSVRRGHDTLDIVVDGSSSAHPYLLKNPDRVVLDFTNAVMLPGLRNIAVHTKDVRQVRVGRFQAAPPVTRVVIDLSGPRAYEVESEAHQVVVRVKLEDVGIQPAAP